MQGFLCHISVSDVCEYVYALVCVDLFPEHMYVSENERKRV